MVGMETHDWEKLVCGVWFEWVEVGSTFGPNVGFGCDTRRLVLGITLCLCIWNTKMTIMFLYERFEFCIT